MDAVASREPFFSVIVLTWNGRHLLEECLDSLLAQTFRDFEIIVVDNGSKDGSVEWLGANLADRVRTVALSANAGFAGGNNAGIRVALGRYIVLLNNDTVVDREWLAALANAVGRHPEAGMFTPKILNHYRRDEIDNTGHLIYPDGLARGQNRLEKDDGRFDDEAEALWPSGCAGVYKREMLEQVGLLDETFFAYGEDVDLGLRARWAGWACYYVPKAVVYHKYSSTTGGYSSQKAFLVERNRIWILLKNFPARELIFSPLWTAYRYGMHLTGILTGRGASSEFTKRHSAWRLFATILRAEVAATAGIPRVIRERIRIRRLRRVDAAGFRMLLRRFSLDAREAALKG